MNKTIEAEYLKEFPDRIVGGFRYGGYMYTKEYTEWLETKLAEKEKSTCDWEPVGSDIDGYIIYKVGCQQNERVAKIIDYEETCHHCNKRIKSIPMRRK